MRVTDLKSKKKVNEKLENWVGDFGAAALRQMGNRFKNDPEGEMSVAQKMGKTRFINDFIARAYGTLNSEIQSGRVDPNLESDAAPSAAAPAAAPVAAPAAPEPQGQALDLDAYKKRREGERAAGIQAQQDVQAQIKQTAATNAATSAADNQLVARVRAEKQKPGFQQDKGLIRQAAVKGIHETKYEKLNAIFENIILNEAESISQFFHRWLPTYMRGVDMSDPHTLKLIKKIEATWGADKGKAALTQLANAAYGASYAPGYGGGSSTRPSTTPSGAAQNFQSSVTKSLDAISNDPRYMDILNALAADIAKRQKAVATTPSPAPVSESKKKIKK